MRMEKAHSCLSDTFECIYENKYELFPLFTKDIIKLELIYKRFYNQQNKNYYQMDCKGELSHAYPYKCEQAKGPQVFLRM